MPASAPCSRQTASLSSLEAQAMTRAPSALPISIAASPTPPAAPRTRTVSPAFSAPRSRSAWSEVAYVSRNAAPVTKSIFSGSGSSRTASVFTSSAKAPYVVNAMTRSPWRTFVTPAPTSFTTPASSLPGENGSGGLNWYLFWMMRKSGKLTLAAFTETTTSPGPGTGEGRSSITSDSGGPYCLQRTAFIAIECHMPKLTTDDGVALHYEETGTGTPLVFVHEFGGDARSYPPSDVPEDWNRYSQERARDDIRSVLDALRIERAHVVGLSMGAFATLHFGLAYPQRALSITVAGGAYGSHP